MQIVRKNTVGPLARSVCSSPWTRCVLPMTLRSLSLFVFSINVDLMQINRTRITTKMQHSK